METSEDAKTKAATTYNAASDHYDDPANSFWQRFGRLTIERLDLSPGAHVLDVCCGSGASAIPAAEAVGSNGLVVGVDLAENLLDLARQKAIERGFSHLEFRVGDMLDLQFPDKHFDAVVCVFGIFFVPDMEAAVRELWRVVKPGGKLAVTTWGPRFFEPVSTVFWNSIGAVKPELYRGFNPWDRLCEPDAVRSLLLNAGVHSAEVVAQQGTHPLSAPEDWWSAVLGSGYRGTIDQLNDADRVRVRCDTFSFINDKKVQEVETNVVYAVATKRS